MKGPAGMLVASLIALGLAAPTSNLAASGSGHSATARAFGLPHSFGAQGESRSRILTAREGRGFGGLGASGAYTTLLSGTFESPPPDTGPGFVVPPPFCYGVPPVAPPPSCVRPLLIHLAPQAPAKNLPRVVYGSPFDCPG